MGSRAAMAKVIIKELESFKKEYAKPRKTVIDNLEEAVVEEKKIEEMDVVFLMDRFDTQKPWMSQRMREIRRRQTQKTAIS